MTPQQTAGLAEARVRAMANIDPDDDAYIADDLVYLDDIMAKWAASQTPAPSQADIDACRERALNSWTGLDAPLPPEAPPLSPEGQKAQLVAYASNRRWLAETGGMTINGMAIPTDDRAKLLLLGAAQSMADGSSAPLVVAGTNYGTLSKAQFQAINTAVVAHVQSTFPVLASAIAAIEAGTITTTAQIDALAWPT